MKEVRSRGGGEEIHKFFHVRFFIGDIPGNDQSCNSGPQSLALGLRGFIDPTTSLGASVFGSGPDIILRADQIEQTPADMALSTLYLHELHHRQVRLNNFSHFFFDA